MLDSTASTSDAVHGPGVSGEPARRREIYVYGERVKDVTTHPAFRNTAR